LGGFLAVAGSGAIKGLKTGAMLLRIMIPVYIAVVLLKHSPLMGFLEGLFAPAMALFDMPGQAAAPIIAGFFSDEYGAVAAMRGFTFSAATATTIAMMNLCMHAIPVETAINRKIGFPAGRIIVFRIALAFGVGLLTARLGAVLL
jgi:spore maturation protein SpmB